MHKDEIENFYSNTGIAIRHSRKLFSEQNYRIYLINDEFVFSEKPNLGSGSRKNLYSLLKKKGIPVPIEKFFWQNEENNYYVENFIHGKSVHSIAKIKQPIVYTQLGKLLKSINEIDMQFYGAIDSNLKGKYSSWSEFIGRFFMYKYEHMKIVPDLVSKNAYKIILSLLTNIIKERKFQPKLLHGDIKAENIICSNTGCILAILDWESAISGDSLLEYANLCLWKDFRPEQIHILAGYNMYGEHNFDYKYFYGYQLFTAFITLCKLFGKGRFKEVNFLVEKIDKICTQCRFL